MRSPDGLVQYQTNHSDTTPDTSTWTDATNQIKFTFDDGNHVTKVEFDPDSEVGDNAAFDTREVDYSYGTDFASAYFKRLNYVEYPDGRKIWKGYTHP